MTTGREGRRTSWKVLFVGKDEEEALLHLAVAQDPVQLLTRLVYPFPILMPSQIRVAREAF